MITEISTAISAVGFCVLYFYVLIDICVSMADSTVEFLSVLNLPDRLSIHHKLIVTTKRTLNEFAKFHSCFTQGYSLLLICFCKHSVQLNSGFLPLIAGQLYCDFPKIHTDKPFLFDKQPHSERLVIILLNCAFEHLISIIIYFTFQN